MTTLASKPIPTDYRRIVLVNPTRYLGNLLIAGGLIQDFYRYCQSRGSEFRLVVDESFRDLLRDSLPEEVFIFYPRQRLRTGGSFAKIRLYGSCLRKIRRFRADIAFNIEEDSVSHRLTLWSGAGFKLGCSVGRHKRGYNHVLRVVFSERPPQEGHRWYGFRQSFSALGMPASAAGYIRLETRAKRARVRASAEAAGVRFSKTVIALHASATKDFKLWPTDRFIRLAELLLDRGAQIVLIGAGAADSRINRKIIASLSTRAADVVDLANIFTLDELATFFTLIDGIAGNDSGPFHLAAAVGLPGCVVFGPTETALWRPLSEKCEYFKGVGPCAPECTKTGCIHDQRCLKSIDAEAVLLGLRRQIGKL